MLIAAYLINIQPYDDESLQNCNYFYRLICKLYVTKKQRHFSSAIIQQRSNITGFECYQVIIRHQSPSAWIWCHTAEAIPGLHNKVKQTNIKFSEKHTWDRTLLKSILTVTWYWHVGCRYRCKLADSAFSVCGTCNFRLRLPPPAAGL